MSNHLIISVITDDQPGIVAKLSRMIMDAQCSICDSRMSRLGGSFAAILMVSGNWNTLTRLEKNLNKLAQEKNYLLSTKQGNESTQEHTTLPYVIETITVDQPGILHELSMFFNALNINIINLSTEHYLAPHTGTPMFAIQMSIEIPASLHIPTIREDFLSLCDEMNLDSSFDPIKIG